MTAAVSLSPRAVQTINEILSRGKGVELGIRNDKLVIWETASRKKYEVVIVR